MSGENMDKKTNKYRVGYIRFISPESYEDQKKELMEAGCQKFCSDEISERRGFEDLKKATRAGDQIVVCSLSRLCRRLDTLRRMTEDFLEDGIVIVSLNKKEAMFDLHKGTESEAFKWLSFYSDYLNECEDDRRKEKDTHKKEEKKQGRPSKFTQSEENEIALEIINSKVTDHPISKAESARKYGVSFTTIARICNDYEKRWGNEKKLSADKSLETANQLK